jgi:hypothetical protein
VSYVPLLGLLLASPVVLQALQGTRPVHEALAVWLVGMVLAAGGVQLWRAVTAPAPPPTLRPTPLGGDEAPPRRRRGD